jgi:hypothetical protein
VHQVIGAAVTRAVLVIALRRVVDLGGDGAALLLGQLVGVSGVEVFVVALAAVGIGVGIGVGGWFNDDLGEYLKGSQRNKLASAI